MQDTSAIIVSAGAASRMNGINKQFALINGIETVGHSMLAFQKCESIAEIVVVTRENDIDRIKDIAEKLSVSKLSAVTTGGDSRQESVIAGLKKISDDTKFISIHDGARPLVNPLHIEKTIADARIFGGASLGVPVKDTIKIVNDGLITDTPPRRFLYITQTPQVFKKSIYYEGVNFAREHSLDFTDDCQLVEAIGIKVCMTNGDYKNIKITTPEDLAIAEAIIKMEEQL